MPTVLTLLNTLTDSENWRRMYLYVFHQLSGEHVLGGAGGSGNPRDLHC